MPGTIYLLKPKANLDEGPSELVHEAAHALHWEDEARISNLWRRNFQAVNQPRSEKVSRTIGRSGIIDDYATWDYIAEPVDSENPRGEPSQVFSLWGTNLSLYGHWEDLPETVYTIINEIATLPGNLSEVVTDVVIDPSLSGEFFAPRNSRKKTSGWDTEAEDIAVHTEGFHYAYHRPQTDWGSKIIGMIHNNPLTAKRLLLLIEMGFLDPETAKILLQR